MTDSAIPGGASAPALDILAEHGSFLLIRGAAGYAVVERRAGRIYPMRDGHRDGAPIEAAAVERMLLAEEWHDEQEARRLFAELCATGDRLARRLW